MRKTSINFLKSCAATWEVSFTTVVSKEKKNICRRVFRFITPDLGVVIWIEILLLLFYLVCLLVFFFFVVLLIFLVEKVLVFVPLLFLLLFFLFIYLGCISWVLELVHHFTFCSPFLKKKKFPIIIVC
jgi:hypothetical protein